jgi:hypothetical protein
MAIYRGSRYDNALVDFVTTEVNGDALPVVLYEFSTFGVIQYVEHTIIEDERLDQIANKFYKNSKLWWLIPELNPQIKDTLTIPAGTKVKILLNV